VEKTGLLGGLRDAFSSVKLPNLDLKGAACSTPAAGESRLAGLETNGPSARSSAASPFARKQNNA
jgi:hypothetical protein